MENENVKKITPIQNEVGDEAKKETPVSEETTTVEETPVSKETTTVEETPVSEETTTVEETPVSEETTTVEETPVSEETTTVEKVELPDDTYVGKKKRNYIQNKQLGSLATKKEEKKPEEETTATTVEETTSKPEETFTEEEVPAPEKKTVRDLESSDIGKEFIINGEKATFVAQFGMFQLESTGEIGHVAGSTPIVPAPLP